ncbi:hypothetical protein [Endozoicomonas sp. ONNA2]|uniref:hypothetical protein n=1 Tax=Endozoicomonas sp. ONNA2 TaxID=2828741 RepID=UPI002148B76D|nr:hypothetical protein [Endozoicomonas sp. ONNA2]
MNGGIGSVQRTTGFDNLAFATESEITEPEPGYLNGSKVTVQPVDTNQCPGIKIGSDKFEKLPKNIRPVKVALKDFRNWVRKCRPTKVLEHLLMGKAKRMLKNQNWGKISPAQSEKALNAITDDREKKNLQQDINDFNNKLKSLNDKKQKLIELKRVNDEFREKYKTILAIADGDMTPSLLNLRNKLVIPFPPAKPGDNPVCYQLDSKSAVVRKNAARQLIRILHGSEGFKKHLESVQAECEIKEQRQELKKELTELSKELKKEYKVVVKDQAEVTKEMMVEEQNKVKGQAREIYDKHKEYYLKTEGEVIQNLVNQANELNETISKCQGNIDNIKAAIFKNKSELRKNEGEFIRTMKLNAQLKDAALKDEDDIGEVDGSKKDSLVEAIDSSQKELERLTDEMKKHKSEYHALLRKINSKVSAKEKELRSMDAELKNTEKKYDDKALELQKKLDRETKASGRETARLVSGSGLKNKTTPQDGSSQPTEDGSSQPNS